MVSLRTVKVLSSHWTCANCDKNCPSCGYQCFVSTADQDVYCTNRNCRLVFCKNCLAEAHFPLSCGVTTESVSAQVLERDFSPFDSFHVRLCQTKFSLKQLFPRFIGIDDDEILKEIQKWPNRTEYIPLYEVPTDLITEMDEITQVKEECTPE